MKKELTNAFGNVFITIEVDQINKWVHTNWIGYLTEENIRTGALAYLEVVKDSGFSCVLNDTRQVLGSWDHSLDWALDEWAPKAIAAGIRHLAMVSAPESFAADSASSFYSMINDFEVKLFDNLPEAINWLKESSLKA